LPRRPSSRTENFPCLAALSALSTHFNNKYAERHPGPRYYGGNQFTDALELLCQRRALAAFGLSAARWGVNVQALSGSPANLAVYTALVPHGGRIMGLALEDGGHLTRGFRTAAAPVSASARFWQSLPYRVCAETALIDYRELDANARLFCPHIIIAGGSAYPRHIDYAAIRRTADRVGAVLMADMAHTAGLVAAGIAPSPFDCCDVVTTTTHKTLRGVRGALIFYRRGERKVGKGTLSYDLEKKINSAVFPGLQGGPHMHQIAGIAVALKDAATPEFKEYQRTVVANMQALSKYLVSHGLKLVTGGTDTHLALIDLRGEKLDGARLEWVLDCANITTNKNTVPGDTSVGAPRGVRVGSPALTSRGLTPADFEQVGHFIVRGFEIGSKVDQKKIKAFKQEVLKSSEVESLRKEVIAFASKFPLPGVVDPTPYQ
jgi:glycine hydroxymethyltransferase